MCGGHKAPQGGIDGLQRFPTTGPAGTFFRMTAPEPRMKISRIRLRATGLAASVVLLGCAGTNAATTTPAPVLTGGNPATAAAAAPIANAGDVNFMKGMIPHHAQAVLIAGWAPSHGARDDVQRLCERIVVAQRDEITMMQNWLRYKGQEVPAADAKGMKMNMDGMTHEMLMPGMLTDDQLKELDAARGSQFDRLFLQAMIKHHLGAISMVEDLEKVDGARQDETVFRFSQDVFADQTTEIDRMEKMLATIK
jgi:uncharacterized protein (DUF305 family)